jgi:hypothetical protein
MYNYYYQACRICNFSILFLVSSLSVLTFDFIKYFLLSKPQRVAKAKGDLTLTRLFILLLKTM